jgi:hypothetical protein
VGTNDIIAPILPAIAITKIRVVQSQNGPYISGLEHGKRCKIAGDTIAKVAVWHCSGGLNLQLIINFNLSIIATTLSQIDTHFVTSSEKNKSLDKLKDFFNPKMIQKQCQRRLLS